jgi:hypothetical protein
MTENTKEAEDDVMKHQRRSILARCSGRIRGGSHPCQDAANVRVNDPLAVGIEELRGFLPRVISLAGRFHKPIQRRNQKKMSATLSNNRGPKQSPIPFALCRFLI